MSRIYSELIRPRTRAGFTILEGAYWVVVGFGLATLFATIPN